MHKLTLVSTVGFFLLGHVQVRAQASYAIPATRSQLEHVEADLRQAQRALSSRLSQTDTDFGSLQQEIEGVRSTLAYAAEAITNLAAVIATIGPIDPTTDEARQFAESVVLLARAYQVHAQDIVNQRVEATNTIAYVKRQVEANMWHGVSEIAWPLQNRTTHVLSEVPMGVWIDPTQLSFAYQTLALISHTNQVTATFPSAVRVFSEDELTLNPGTHFVSILGLDTNTVFVQIREASKWERKQ